MNFPIDTFRRLDTPFYFYDMQLLQQTLQSLIQACNPSINLVHYAIKANPNPRILSLIAKSGFGADTVSGGEIEAALRAGFPAEKIVFAGVGKSDSEIRLALRSHIGCLNVESIEELANTASIASELGGKAPVALRVNPEIDAHTHHFITTGLAENKFGIAMSMLDEALTFCLESPHLDFRGFHFHIGSQVTITEPFVELSRRINLLQQRYSDVEIPTINVGGGLGIEYDDPDANPIPDFRPYFNAFNSNIRLRPGQQIHFELGRSIVGQCGSLISRVLYVKRGVDKQFAILDAGFTDLIRPALYGAHHKIQNLTSHSPEVQLYDVVGPICESSDTFATDEPLPLTQRGDIVALRSAGAYGEAMSSQYNCRPLTKSVFSDAL